MLCTEHLASNCRGVRDRVQGKGRTFGRENSNPLLFALFI